MVINIPKVEPFTFQAVTAFMERKELADKLNEVIDALNGIGDVPELQMELDALKAQVADIEASIGDTDTNLASVESKLNQTISDLNALSSKVSGIEATQEAHTTQIRQNIADISALDTRMDTAESGIEANKSDIDTIEAKQTEHETEIQGLLREVVDGVTMSSTAHGTVQVTINHEDGTQDTSAPIDLGLVREGGITLSTGATDRSFKLTVQLSDGSSWQTNDFVIPEGGGTEVVVTSVQIKQGSQNDMMKVSIGLSDGSSIDSNDWTFVTPAQFAALQSTVSTNSGDITSLTGRVTAIDTQLDTIDGSLDSLGDRVTALEGSPGYSLPIATAAVLGGVKIGANINVTADGVISVTFPDAPDLSPYATKSELSELTGEMMNSPGNIIGMASPSASGLMSNTDKTKLNGIADNANNYVLPIGGTAIGGVKNGGNVTIESDGTMNVSDNDTIIGERIMFTDYIHKPEVHNLEIIGDSVDNPSIYTLRDYYIFDKVITKPYSFSYLGSKSFVKGTTYKYANVTRKNAILKGDIYLISNSNSSLVDIWTFGITDKNKIASAYIRNNQLGRPIANKVINGSTYYLYKMTNPEISLSYDGSDPSSITIMFTSGNSESVMFTNPEDGDNVLSKINGCITIYDIAMATGYWNEQIGDES